MDTARERSKKFAVRIVGLYKRLSDKKEFVLGQQILRAGTSIGANLAEAECAISKRDFLKNALRHNKNLEKKRKELSVKSKE